MSNFNSSANNNFSSIDPEFGLTTNNTTTNKTMNNQSIDAQFANPKNIISKTFNFASFGNPNAETELTVVINTDTNMIAWGYANRWYRLAPKLVSVSSAGEVVATYDTDVQSDRDELIDIIFDSVSAMKLRGKAVALLEALIGTVLLDEWELSDYGVHSYNCASIMTATGNLIDAQEVLRKDVVRAFWTSKSGVILTKKLRGDKGAWTEGCLEATMKHWGYAMPDKNNSKCAYVQASLGVMGLSADGMKSIVKADKVGKFFSRHSMVKHISAEVEEPTFDSLVSEVDNNRFAVHNGIALDATYVKHPLISLIAGDGGIISRKEITAISNKRLRGSFNLDILLCSEAEQAQPVREAIADLGCNQQFKKVIELMTEEFKTIASEGIVLQPRDCVSFAGQTIITNHNNVAVEIAKFDVSKGEAINTSVRTLDVSFRAKVRDTSYNHKLRGQWLKGMSFRNDNLVIEGDSSDIIINDNCVKNVEGIYLRMFANSVGQLVSWCKDGNLRKVEEVEENQMVMGDILDTAEVDEWLKANSRIAKITAILDVAELAEFKQAKPEAFGEGEDVVETSLPGGKVQITFDANVISAPLVCAIELSSVAENYSVARNLSPISSNYLSTFSVLLDNQDKARHTASNNIRKYAEKVAKTIHHCGSKKPDAVFNLLIPAKLEALQAVLIKAGKANNPRDLFGVLASKYPNGIKISGGVVVSADKSLRPWEVFIPTHLIKVVAGFNPRNGFAYDDNIKNTYAFLLMVSKFDGESLEQYHLVADYAMKVGKGLELWKDDTVRSSKSLTKGTSAFYNHGMKVIANPEVGYEVVEGNNKTGAVSIPRVVLDETNPLVVANPDNPKLSMAIGKDGRYAKLVKDGDIVFTHRNPVIDLTPCVVKVAKAQTIAGKFVVAMPPSALVWSSHSDVDGDVLWLIPGKQIGITNLEQAGRLMSHPLVGKDIANRTMASLNAGSLIGGIISKPNCGFALDEREPLIVEYMNSDIARHQYPKYEDRVKARWARVVELAEKTAQHYTINTGKGYQCMFNAYSKFISDALGGNINQQQNVLVGIKATSFVIYEEWALGGYSEANEALFITLDDQAKELLGTKKKSSRSLASRRNSLTTGGIVDNSINLCSPYMAMAKVQSLIENSNQPSVKDEEYAVVNLMMAKQSWVHFDAVRFGLFRTLTKGAFAYGDSSRINPIFAKHYSADDNNPYQPVISAWKHYVSYSL